jgi:hypothetical protein
MNASAVGMSIGEAMMRCAKRLRRAAFDLETSLSSGEKTASLRSIWASVGPIPFGLKGSNFDFSTGMGLDPTWTPGIGRAHPFDTPFGPVNFPKRPSYTAQIAVLQKY